MEIALLLVEFGDGGGIGSSSLPCSVSSGTYTVSSDDFDKGALCNAAS